MIKFYYYCAYCKEWYKQEDWQWWWIDKKYNICPKCFGDVHLCFEIISSKHSRKLFDFCGDCDNKFICLTGGN